MLATQFEYAKIYFDLYILDLKRFSSFLNPIAQKLDNSHGLVRDEVSSYRIELMNFINNLVIFPSSKLPSKAVQRQLKQEAENVDAAEEHNLQNEAATNNKVRSDGISGGEAHATPIIIQDDSEGDSDKEVVPYNEVKWDSVR